MKVVCFVNNYLYGENRFSRFKEQFAYREELLDDKHHLVFLDLPEESYKSLRSLLNADIHDNVRKVEGFSELGFIKIFQQKLEKMKNKYKKDSTFATLEPQGLVEEKEINEPIVNWKKKHPGKMTFKEWLKENYNLDIIVFSERPEGYKRRIKASYDYYLHPEDYEEVEIQDSDSLESKLRKILSENNKSKIELFEVNDMSGSFVENFENESVDFKNLKTYERTSQQLEEGKPVASFMITGGRNGSGKWEEYLDDLESLFRAIDKETGYKPLLYKVDTDIADDVWNGYVFLYDNTNKKLEDSLKLFKDSKIQDIIKKEAEGYIIYSHKGKRLSKPFKTKEEAEKRLKQIEMFKHMNDSSYKGYAIEHKADLWQVWKDTPEGDEKVAGDFPSEEEAREWIDAQEVSEPEQLHHYDVYYTDYDSDTTFVENDVLAKSELDAKRKVKLKYGKAIYGYPHDAILVDSKKEIKDMFEEIKNWLSQYLVKKSDPKNKLGKSYIRALKGEERLPNGVYHKAGTDNSGILHFKGTDYYWYLDPNDKIIVERYIKDSVHDRFVCESFFDEKRKGLEDRFETNDLGKAKDWLLEKSNKGFISRVIDKLTGEVWLFDEIEDPFELDKIRPYEEELEDLDEDIIPNEEIELWNVEWYNDKGFKFTGEFDSEEDAKEFISEQKLENAKIRKSHYKAEDSKIKDEKPIEEIKDIIDKCYNYGDYDVWVDKILVKHGLPANGMETETIFDKMSEQQIRDAYKEIRNELKAIINNSLDDFMEDRERRELANDFEIKFELIDDSIEDEEDSKKIINVYNQAKEILNKELQKEKINPEEAKIEVRHEKDENGDKIILNGSLNWVASKLEEKVVNQIKDLLEKEFGYANVEFRWFDELNAAGGEFTIKG